MGLKTFLAGILTGVFLFVGCASTFGYRYYGIEVADWNGTLVGPKPKDDLPFASCAPQPGLPHPCVVVFATEWRRLKTDFKTLQTALTACQKGGN